MTKILQAGSYNGTRGVSDVVESFPSDVDIVVVRSLISIREALEEGGFDGVLVCSEIPLATIEEVTDQEAVRVFQGNHQVRLYIVPLLQAAMKFAKEFGVPAALITTLPESFQGEPNVFRASDLNDEQILNALGIAS